MTEATAVDRILAEVDEPADPMVERLEQRAARAEAEGASNGDGRPSLEQRLEEATLTSEQLKNMPRVPQLVDGILARDSIAVLYGPSGGGKTFTTVDLALSIVTGSWWHGRRVEPGPVVYVVAEGAARLGQRVGAWQEHHQVYELEGHHPVHWLPLAVNLHDVGSASALTAYCEARSPVLVVIDTLARCTVGADENSAKDMGEVVYQLDALRRRTATCVLLVHHSGKDVAAGARGSSALRAAVDTELEVAGSEGAVTLRVRKQKDGAEVAPIPMRLRPIAESCVLVQPSLWTPDGEAAVTSGALATLDALRSIQVAGGIAASVWQKSAPCEERAFYNHRRQLLDADLVRNVGSDGAPRYLSADFDIEEAAG